MYLFVVIVSIMGVIFFDFYVFRLKEFRGIYDLG